LLLKYQRDVADEDTHILVIRYSHCLPLLVPSNLDYNCSV